MDPIRELTVKDVVTMNFNLGGWEKAIRWVVVIVISILAIWILRKATRKVFQKLQKDQKNLHLAFLERLIEFAILLSILVLAISSFGGAVTVWQTLLGGTAVLSAVIAFAAQDAIKDMLAGLMISVHKPFEIGSRIELEDGTEGIVEDITMRHIVLKNVDSVRKIIPNSRLNGMRLTNFSYRSSLRSIQFRFSVSYDSDVARAKEVIARSIQESPYSVPGKKDENGKDIYPPVYFISYADSALVMMTTVYFASDCPPEIVKNDVNTRVRAALADNDIEIPYQHVTIVTKGKGN